MSQTKRILPAIGKWLGGFQTTLIPPTCILCGAEGNHRRDICDPCGLDLPWLTAACPRCAEPMDQSVLCGRCQSNPPPYQHSTAVFYYQEPVSHLITSLKFRDRLSNAKLLGELAADRFAVEEELPDLIVPVPMHRKALRKRGYNQALELARPVARRLGIPIDWRSCRKTRVNSPQFQLPMAERARNVRGVYRIEGRIDCDHAVVFDDVMTTGATAGAVALALRRAGVKRVGVWCLARAMRVL